jgi:hypothetical protein
MLAIAPSIFGDGSNTDSVSLSATAPTDTGSGGSVVIADNPYQYLQPPTSVVLDPLTEDQAARSAVAPLNPATGAPTPVHAQPVSETLMIADTRSAPVSDAHLLVFLALAALAFIL